MNVNYIEETEKQMEERIQEKFTDFFKGKYIVYTWDKVYYHMKKRWLNFSMVKKIYFYSNHVTIELYEDSFKELEPLLQQFEDKTGIRVDVEVQKLKTEKGDDNEKLNKTKTKS